MNEHNDVQVIAETCLYDLYQFFQSYLEDFKGKDLSEFEQGQQLAYEQIVQSVKTRIDYFEDLTSEERASSESA